MRRKMSTQRNQCTLKNCTDHKPAFTMPLFCTPVGDDSNAASSSSDSQSTDQAVSNTAAKSAVQSSDDSSSSSTSDSASASASETDNLLPNRMTYPASAGSQADSTTSPQETPTLACSDVNCSDVNCQPSLVDSSCTDPACSDPNCGISQNSTTPSVCTDENCNCNHESTNNARNFMIGITGLLIIMMLGYIAYMKKKPSGRSKQNVFRGDDAERGGVHRNPVPPVFVEKSRL